MSIYKVLDPENGGEVKRALLRPPDSKLRPFVPAKDRKFTLFDSKTKIFSLASKVTEARYEDRQGSRGSRV